MARRAVLRLAFGLALLPALWLAPAAAARADTEPLQIAGSSVRFATESEARAALSADDVFIATTSNFQRAATMGVLREITPMAFREYLATTALAWSPAEQDRWTSALKSIAPRLAALRAPLPAQVLLVQTNGRDSANTPYTRGTTIFLPARFAGPPDTELIAHELFHVITRANPALATRLYAELGFEPAGELLWPREWLEGRISNPDAPFSRHVMRIEINGKPIAVMPLLVARTTRLQPGQTFFDVLDVRLLAVEPGQDGAASQPARQPDGRLLWGLAERTPAFLAKLGGNTRYIFHPEETAADNFSYLVTGKAVPNPTLLQKFEQVFLERKP